jgi:hypothetical protein
MTTTEWNDAALACSDWLVREKPFSERAVGASIHDGACVVFGPECDKARIHADLAAAGVKVLGTGTSTGPKGGHFFASIVETTDDELLRRIVRA